MSDDLKNPMHEDEIREPLPVDDDQFQPLQQYDVDESVMLSYQAINRQTRDQMNLILEKAHCDQRITREMYQVLRALCTLLMPFTVSVSIETGVPEEKIKLWIDAHEAFKVFWFGLEGCVRHYWAKRLRRLAILGSKPICEMFSGQKMRSVGRQKKEKPSDTAVGLSADAILGAIEKRAPK